ncbi:hypothetical protein NCS52_00337400 [Fusarium sp. LHS14.1]|nr:hypothetical protein NCS52_00337400 [Fusarium sp. LHS14.1]
MNWNTAVVITNLLTGFQPLTRIVLICIICRIKQLMKRRRRNPQARNSQDRDYHLRSLLRRALVQKLDLDFMPSRQYRLEQPKRWQSCSSSDSRESSAALSLDRYVKAFIGDKCTEEKEDRRNCTPGAPEGFDTQRGLRSSSPLHMDRIEECSTSIFSISDEHADWSQHGYHNLHQLSTFQIRDQGGGWEHVRVLPGLSSGQPLISEDSVHRLGMSLTPMPQDFLPSIDAARFNSAEPRWFVSVQIRASTDMSPESVKLVSTKLLPVGVDILIGKGLFDVLRGVPALGSMSMSPESLNWTPHETWISTSSTIDDHVWPPEIGAQFTQEYLDNPQCSISPPDSNIAPSWSGSYGSIIELSSSFA